MKTEITLTENDIQQLFEGLYPGKLKLLGLKKLKVSYVDDIPFAAPEEKPEEVSLDTSCFEVDQMLKLRYPGDIPEVAYVETKAGPGWLLPSNKFLPLSTFQMLLGKCLKFLRMEGNRAVVDSLGTGIFFLDKEFLVDYMAYFAGVPGKSSYVRVHTTSDMHRLCKEEFPSYWEIWSRYGTLSRVKKDFIEKHGGSEHIITHTTKGVSGHLRVHPMHWQYASIPEIACTVIGKGS